MRWKLRRRLCGFVECVGAGEVEAEKQCPGAGVCLLELRAFGSSAPAPVVGGSDSGRCRGLRRVLYLEVRLLIKRYGYGRFRTRSWWVEPSFSKGRRR